MKVDSPPYYTTLVRLLAAATLMVPGEIVALQRPAIGGGNEALVQLRVSSVCRGCRVELRPVATISDSAFEVDLNFPRISRLADGKFVVGGTGGVMGAFDGGGAFLRKFGQTGSGPGEFRRPLSLLSGSEDSVYVDDLTLSRMTVVDPALRQAVRTFPVPPHVDAIRLQDGRFIVSGYLATVQRAGLPLHVIEASGRLAQSFGVDSPVVRENPNRMLTRYLSPHPNGGFISAMTYRYEFEHWSNSLVLLKRFVREVNWFPPMRAEQSVDFLARSPLPAQLFGVSTTPASSIAFATIILAAKDWKPDPRIKGTSGELSFMPPRPVGIYVNKYVDTIFEAIDLSTGSVLATSRFPGSYSPISHTPYHWTLKEQSDGNVMVQIVKAELVHPKP